MTVKNTEELTEAEPLKEKKIKTKETFREKFNNVRKNITVEPVAILILSSSILASVTSQTLNLEKACRVNLDLGQDICDSLRRQDSNNNSHHEKVVQEYIAIRLAWRSIVQSVLPCILLPFIGGWSDMTGKRKIVMVLPLIGEIFQCFSNIINVILFYQFPVEVLIFFDAFFPAITGGWSVMFLGIFSYIGDVTTIENRTHRLGFVSFCTFVGLPIGLALSGVILKQFGYYAVYGTSLFLHLINMLYITCKLKDPRRNKEQTMHDGKGFCYFLRTFFNLSNVKATLRVITKNEPKHRKSRLIVLLAVVCVLFGPMYGEVAIMYMTTRYRFNWDEVKFSIFQTYNFVTHTIGTIFSILVFSKYLGWHDSVLGIISTTSKIAASFIYCFASNEKIFFIAPLVEILNGTALLSIRSIFSKLVEPEELGKVNSIIGLTENLMPLLYVPLYTKVYTLTMEVLPGAVFLMGASMTLPAVMVFSWLFYEHRRKLRKSRNIT